MVSDLVPLVTKFGHLTIGNYPTLDVKLLTYEIQRSVASICLSVRTLHCVSKKHTPFYFYDNFVRCRPIFIILSLADSSGNLQ